MATAKKTAAAAPAKEDKKASVPALKKETPLAEVEDQVMFAADAGAGMENATADSYAIPFIVILQKMSPQVDENEGAYMEGARPGMILNNVTGELFDGQEGVTIVPVMFKREFIRWGARDAGGGFKGALTVDEVTKLRMDGLVKELDGTLFFPEKDGSVDPKKSDRLGDHRNHYVLLVDDDGDCRPALLSLTSTQIKKSKHLMSMLADVRVRDAHGNKVQPASFANNVRLTTVGEKNDKGTWFGVKCELQGFVTKDVYQQAKVFYESVKKGDVNVKYEDQADAPRGGGSSADRDDPNGAF